MRPKAEWAIDSEAMRARGIIVFVLVKSTDLVGQKNIETKHLSQAKARRQFLFYRQNITNMAGTFRY